jgi:hypothetical protein
MIAFDLVADDPAQYRSLAESEWVTLRGKRNRIAIGSPVCTPETIASDGSLLIEADSAAYGAARPQFYRISFSLTLVPDVDCRFRNVDTILDLGTPGEKGPLPLFVRLKPSKRTATRAVKQKFADNAKLAVKENVLKLIGAELGSKMETEVQFERVDVHMASFGAGTRSAGWRLHIAEGRDIPLATEELHALVAVPPGQIGQLRFRVAAQIDVQTAVDRVLTRLFLRNSSPGAAADYEFPPR